MSKSYDKYLGNLQRQYIREGFPTYSSVPMGETENSRRYAASVERYRNPQHPHPVQFTTGAGIKGTLEIYILNPHGNTDQRYSSPHCHAIPRCIDGRIAVHGAEGILYDRDLWNAKQFAKDMINQGLCKPNVEHVFQDVATWGGSYRYPVAITWYTDEAGDDTELANWKFKTITINKKYFI